jgi:hypothetical protein
MNRIPQKVRDLVDVRPYTIVDDFLRDPAGTISNYHFTDVTAYMMSRWLTAVSGQDPAEMCRAIAGFRGVGKSHFLATFATLLSHPELRSRVAESHVLSSCQELLRRHYPVINVRRGLRENLFLEVGDAVRAAFELGTNEVWTTLDEVIDTVLARASGLTPIFIFDSARERSSPVDRNDGQILAEVAVKCAARGIFVGLALDDDIAGADGSNAAIASAFKIEYLDPENLYKVVNTHIFPKNPRTLDLLGTLYEGFRASIPAFRWSEQKFALLYPLHPATLDLAPFIRSYVPNFALFGFASSAGEKILGRPADSLIGVEDFFDVVEYELRKVDELGTVFRDFDSAMGAISSDVPVSGRHMAKLALKVVFLNSIARRGVSAGEIAGAIMLTESDAPGSSVRDIDAILAGIRTALPESLNADSSDAANIRYSFNIGSDEFTQELNELVTRSDPGAVQTTFYAAVSERFPELSGSVFSAETAADLYSLWRGSLRPGRVRLNSANLSKQGLDRRLDWEVILNLNAATDSDGPSRDDVPFRIEWSIGELTAEERRSLAMHSVLSTNSDLRNKYHDQFPTAVISAATAVAAAVDRVMVADARLKIDGFDYNFSEAARAQADLGSMIGAMLEPLFEAVHFEHPYFIDPLNDDIVVRFVKCLSDGESSASPLDQAALTFGVPLGLVEFGETGYAILSKERLTEISFVASILAELENGDADEREIRYAERCLAAAPVGLSSQATKLILSAMAYRGLIELITVDRERIAGRSIDLKLDWSTIVSFAVPKASTVAPEKLLEWANLITGDSSISSLADPQDRGKVIEAFVEIANQWERRNPFEQFDTISDCEFNTAMWKHSNRTWDAYAAMVVNINEALNGNITLEQSIECIRADFAGQPAAFFESRSSVTAIEDFVKGFPTAARIEQYLAVAEMTTDDDVEAARNTLRNVLRAAANNRSEQSFREVGYAWDKFLRLYTEHYVALHTAECKLPDLSLFAEHALRPGEWSEIVRLVADLSGGHPAYGRLREIRRKFLSLQCSLDPATHLAASPTCECGFTPSPFRAQVLLTQQLRTLSEELIPNISDEMFAIPEDLVLEPIPSIR